MTKIRKILFFALGICIIAALGFVAKQNKYDDAKQNLLLVKNGETECVVDLGKTGLPKRILQPALYSVSLGLETEGNPVLNCKVDEQGTDGIKIMLTQGHRKRATWEKLPADNQLSKAAKKHGGAKKLKGIPLNLEISVPRSSLKQQVVAEKKLIFTEDGKPYCTLLVRIINSSIK